MRRLHQSLVLGAAMATIACASLPATAQAAPATRDGGAAATQRPDNRPGPKTEKWLARKAAAQKLVAEGKAKPNAEGVVELQDGTFAEVTTTKTDKIFTILSEFGTQAVNRYGTAPGPLHNEIPKPDRSVDNSTTWEADYDTAYYEELFNGSGESMKRYYEDLSNGRYSVVNTVSDWVKVPYNASYYGDNAIEDFGGSWQFIEDTGNAWYDAQIAAGLTPAQIDAYLAQFDVWDRYDFDNDGDFDEADGYIDHFQAVHAGEGEDAGGGAQGEDAIWSHRWYVNPTDSGSTGPTVGTAANFQGGARIGGSRYWLGDYTTEPENGGLGVFAHEYGHDLGLPDFYDTGGGENGSAFWTLMSSGSWLGHGQAANDGIGTTPGLMGPEEKYFLGWLDYAEVGMGQSGTYTLNPSQFHVDGKEQAIKVDLPAKTTETTYATPPSGTHAWWTGSADNLNESLTRTVPAGSRVTVTASAWYDIEEGYDFLVGEYSLDRGATWTRVGSVVDGSSNGRWSSIRFAYSPGAESLFRFRYVTDGGLHLDGALLDDIRISVGSTTALSDDVESGVNGWDHTGQWKISTGTESTTSPRYYLLENRQYQGYDATLEVGPYQFCCAYTAPDKVQFFPFQNGMLTWFVDHSQEDNNTSEHPGAGLAMVVDARPSKFTYPDGSAPSNRRQPFDATFGLEKVDPVCLTKEVLVKKTVETVSACATQLAPIATFDDTNPDAYYDAANPQNSVRVAGHGVKATVTAGTTGDLTVTVTNPAAR